MMGQQITIPIETIKELYDMAREIHDPVVTFSEDMECMQIEVIRNNHSIAGKIMSVLGELSKNNHE